MSPSTPQPGGVGLAYTVPSPERFSFANDEALPLPDLVAIQRDSFQRFLDKGLAEAFNDMSPIEDFMGQLSLEPELTRPTPTCARRRSSRWRSARRRT